MLAAILVVVVCTLLVDVLLIPWFPLPAVLYALLILIAAHFLPPAMVVVVTVWDALALLVAAWIQQPPFEQVALYESSVIVLGYLTVSLSVKMRRESKLKAEMAMLASERQRVIGTLRALIDALPVGVFVYNGAGTVTLANSTAGAVLDGVNGGAADRLGRDDVLRSIDANPLPHEEHPIWRCLQQGTPTKDIEIVVRSDGGKERALLAAANPIRDQEGAITGAVAAFQDITERKRIQAQLLQQQRALAALAERERLARELHDDLGQVLAYLSYQAESIRKLLSCGHTVTADIQLARLIEVAGHAHTDVREHIIGLRAAVPPTNGLLAAVDDHLRRFGENCGISTELVVTDGQAALLLDPAAEAQLLRVIQEALTNVRKHACARHVSVTLALQDGWLEVSVEDDGRGFDPERSSAFAGQTYGLQIMRERLQEVGGKLSVHSARGRGTKVIAQLPLHQEKED